MSVNGALKTTAMTVPIHSTSEDYSHIGDQYDLSEFFTTTPSISVIPMDILHSVPIPSLEVTEELLRMAGQQWLVSNGWTEKSRCS